MIDSNIIYEGKYPQITGDDYEQLFGLTSGNEMTRSTHLSPEERCRKLFESTVRVLMPERLEGKKTFVNLAKHISEAYEINTVITENGDRITAQFEVDCYNHYAIFQKIILLSDEISFDIRNDEVIFSIFYYTHATYRSGQRITPPLPL